METSKKDVEGEQSQSHPNEVKKETTDPSINKKPVVGNPRARARGMAGTKKASPELSAAKTIPASSPSKTVASRGGNVIMPIETGLKKETGTNGQNIYKTDEKMNDKKSAVDNKAKGGKYTALESKSKNTSNKLKVKADAEKGLKTLNKNAKKAERKVVKLEKKVEKAKKKDVKRSTLQVLKDKLLIAFSKLKSSNKKLKKVNK